MKKYLLSMICALLPMFSWAQEPYAVMIDDNTAIQFRYDNNRASYSESFDIGPFASPDDRPWEGYAPDIYSVIFEPSFVNCASVTSTAYWFTFFENLEYVGGLEYLNTSNVTSMASMFMECWNLPSLDLTSFSTQNVTDMSFMFSNCSKMTTITVGSGWTTSNVAESSGMFEECLELVGGNGTPWSPDHTDASYAHVDVANNPGYLSGEASPGGDEAQYWIELRSTLDYALDLRERAQGNANVEPWMQEELTMMIEHGEEMYSAHEAEEDEVRHMIEELNWICWEIEEAMNQNPQPSDPEPYAVLSDNNTVLTFYYDTEKNARGGLDIGPFTANDERWGGHYEEIQSVVFDQSMAGCTSITSTAQWFAYCGELRAISGLEYLNTSNVTSMAGMFHRCTSLQSIDVSHFNTSSVTNMSYMFAHCYSLQSLDLSNFDTSNVTDMTFMFFGEGSTIYTSLDLSSFNTSRVTFTVRMFAGNPALTTIYVSSGWDMSNVTESLDMFYMCERLVGGRGTQWNPDHVDAEYAHIDGGSNNPGYLTDINGTPPADLHELEEAIAYANSVVERARNNSCVEPWAIEELEMFIAQAREVLDNPSPDPQEISYIAMELTMRAQTVEDMICDESQAWFDGLTAWVYGNATLDDAFSEVGRDRAAETIAAIVWEGEGALTSDQLGNLAMNPNLLIYVSDASKAPAGFTNLIVNGYAEQIALTDPGVGNGNFHCPQAFTARAITYTRPFSQSTEIGVCRGWETIAVPFNVQAVIQTDTYRELRPFGADSTGTYPFWLRQLEDYGFRSATLMQANRPYLISMPNNPVYPSAYNQAGSVSFIAAGVTVPVTEPREAFGANVTLVPTFQTIQGSGDIYRLNVGVARGDNPEGSVFESGSGSVRPFQAYLRRTSQARPDGDSSLIPLTSLGIGGDDVTGLIEIIQPSAAAGGDDVWYTLDGRRLNGKPTAKGVYISNGKKKIIR